MIIHKGIKKKYYYYYIIIIKKKKKKFKQKKKNRNKENIIRPLGNVIVPNTFKKAQEVPLLKGELLHFSV